LILRNWSSNRVGIVAGHYSSEDCRAYDRFDERSGQECQVGKVSITGKLSTAVQNQAMQLRYLTTLQTIAGERTNTIIFPLPIKIIGDLTSGKP